MYGAYITVFFWTRQGDILPYSGIDVDTSKRAASTRLRGPVIDYEVAIDEEALEREVVREVIAEHPPRERGVREEWTQHWGIGRKYNPSG